MTSQANSSSVVSAATAPSTPLAHSTTIAVGDDIKGSSTLVDQTSSNDALTLSSSSTPIHSDTRRYSHATDDNDDDDDDDKDNKFKKVERRTLLRYVHALTFFY